jgi:hypothetical protein
MLIRRLFSFFRRLRESNDERRWDEWEALLADQPLRVLLAAFFLRSGASRLRPRSTIPQLDPATANPYPVTTVGRRRGDHASEKRKGREDRERGAHSCFLPWRFVALYWPSGMPLHSGSQRGLATRLGPIELPRGNGHKAIKASLSV